MNNGAGALRDLSDWLTLSDNKFPVVTINVNDASLPSKDGVVHVTVAVNDATKGAYKPLPVFLHLARGRVLDGRVPIIAQEQPETDAFGPGFLYVDPGQRSMTGYPANPNLEGWSVFPDHQDITAQQNLFVEPLMPTTDQLEMAQMWWEQLNGDKFVRAFLSRRGEDHRTLLAYPNQQDRFPFRDGRRGVAWTSAYVAGEVDATGGLAFAEAGGPIRYLQPTGEIVTVAGYKLQAGREPRWFVKPIADIRAAQEFVPATGSDEFRANGGAKLPMDVALDPTDERVWYVAAYEDHVIWKVDRRVSPVTVTVLAGQPRQLGYINSSDPRAARFFGPMSLSVDRRDGHRHKLYVADQDNDAIRLINLSTAEVSTAFGKQPGEQSVRGQLTSLGRAPDAQIGSVRDLPIRYEVSAADAQSGVRPTIYLPQTVRVNSRGDLIVLEVGFGSIRRIKASGCPTQPCGETRKFAEVRQEYTVGPPEKRGWAWLDVNRYGGSAGPLDTIYFCLFKGHLPNCDKTKYPIGCDPAGLDGYQETELRPQETWAYVPDEPALTGGRTIFGRPDDDNPDGWGPITNISAPHYPWLIAVDRRGALLMAGAIEHGIVRLRWRRPTDPTFNTVEEVRQYGRGQRVWTTGEASLAPAASRSQAFKFGWGAHNFLGFQDAWDMTLDGLTDEQLLDRFDVPAQLRNPTDRPDVVNFLRKNLAVR